MKSTKGYVDIKCPIVNCKKNETGRIEKKCSNTDKFNIKKGIIMGGKIFKLFSKDFREKMNKKIKRKN